MVALQQLEHHGKRWKALLRPVVSSEVHPEIEIVFVAEDGGEKYAWPMGPPLLQAIVEGGISLDSHRLRKMLRRAMDVDRRPSAGQSRDDGVVSKVRKLLE